MEFKISKSVFSSALNIVKRAISSVAPIPSLIGILIEVKEDHINLVGSDSELSILKTLYTKDNENKLEIIKEGSIVLDSRYITELVSKMDSDIVNLEIIDGTLVKISGNNAEFKINGIKSNDYPNISFDIRNEYKKINVSLFEKIIKQTIFACSQEEVRPALTGINFNLKNNKLICTATNSFRLAKKELDIESDNSFNITIPSKTLKNVIGIIDGEFEIEVAIDTNKIIFKLNNTIIRGRLIEDIYPDISRLIPPSFSQTLIINTKELLGAVERTSFIKSDGKNVVKMCVDDNKLEIHSVSQEIGSSHEVLEIVEFSGNPINISCNGNFLIDALRTINNQNVILKFSGELKPIVIVSEDDEGLVQLISPIRN